MNAITRAEQSDILSLIRQRAKVAKADAQSRAAQMVADFETQLDTHYSYDQSEVWEAAYELAERTVEEAQRRVAEESARLGIPKEFAPRLAVGWRSAGQQATKQRKVELRRLAAVHIEAQAKRACAEIDRNAVRAQTELVASGMSEAAKAFLTTMPTAEQLLPMVQLSTVQALLKENKRD